MVQAEFALDDQQPARALDAVDRMTPGGAQQPIALETALGAYQQAQDVTMRRIYLETMEEILRRNPKVIIDDKVQGLVPFLQLNEQNRPAAPQSRPQGGSPAPAAPAFPPSRPNAGLPR